MLILQMPKAIFDVQSESPEGAVQEREGISTGRSGKVRFSVPTAGYFARGRKGRSRQLPREESVSLQCQGLADTVHPWWRLYLQQRNKARVPHHTEVR